jgi:hypothetical protein
MRRVNFERATLACDRLDFMPEQDKDEPISDVVCF